MVYSLSSFQFDPAAFRSYWHFEIRMSRVGARTQPIVGISIVCGLDLQSANIVRVNYNSSHTTKDVFLLSSSAYICPVIEPQYKTKTKYSNTQNQNVLKK